MLATVATGWLQGVEIHGGGSRPSMTGESNVGVLRTHRTVVEPQGACEAFRIQGARHMLSDQDLLTHLSKCFDDGEVEALVRSEPAFGARTPEAAAVKVVHRPTGVEVLCDEQPTQIRNKSCAAASDGSPDRARRRRPASRRERCPQAGGGQAGRRDQGACREARSEARQDEGQRLPPEADDIVWHSCCRRSPRSADRRAGPG